MTYLLRAIRYQINQADEWLNLTCKFLFVYTMDNGKFSFKKLIGKTSLLLPLSPYPLPSNISP